MKFIDIKTGDTGEYININLEQVTYLSIEAKTVRLSDGLVLHITEDSLNRIRERISRYGWAK